MLYGKLIFVLLNDLLLYIPDSLQLLFPLLTLPLMAMSNHPMMFYNTII